MEEQPGIGYFLSEIENALNVGKKVSFGKGVVVDKAVLLEKIDNIRRLLPQMTGEAFVDKAKQEAERILQNAETERAKRIDESGITKEAEDRARKVIADAQAQAQQMMKDAKEYKESCEKKYKEQAIDIFKVLHDNLAETLQWVDASCKYIISYPSNDKKE